MGAALGSATTGEEAIAGEIQLTAAQRQLVRQLIDAVIPGARVAVFGSRATGRARPFSDLDLVFTDPPCLSWVQRAALRDALESSALPFVVDLVDRAALSEAIAARVDAEARALD